MKYFSKISIYAGITALSLTCFVGCKNNNNTTIKNKQKPKQKGDTLRK